MRRYEEQIEGVWEIPHKMGSVVWKLPSRCRKKHMCRSPFVRKGSFCFNPTTTRASWDYILAFVTSLVTPVVAVTCYPPSPCHLGTALWSLHDWQDQCVTFTSEWEVGGRSLPALYGGPWVIWENSPATWPTTCEFFFGAWRGVTRWGDQVI